jgi:hypothetical protein
MNVNLPASKEVLANLDSYLSLLKSKWDALYPNKKSWFSVKDNRILDCTIFLISTLDNLILFVQDHVERGSDKKIIVMSVVSKVFDYIVTKSFPVWLQPFVPTIKQIVISIVISQLIEFIVKKYKDGSWKPVEAPQSNPPDAPQDQPKSIVYISRKEKRWKK